MDNRVFNVNGCKREWLLDALKLAFAQKGDKTLAKGYFVTKTHGMVLTWWDIDGGKKGYSKFPSPLTAEAVYPLVVAWLDSKPEVEMKDWDADYDHDGDNEPGWRVFVEDWGHVDNEHSAICAIKPAMMWYGK